MGLANDVVAWFGLTIFVVVVVAVVVDNKHPLSA